jgi:hypothetical protein
MVEEITTISNAVRLAIDENEAVKSLFWFGFPRFACGDATSILGTILANAGHVGFKCVSGENDDFYGRYQTHAWLQRGDLIVDITADQFDDVDDSVIVSTDSAWHRKWRIGKITPGSIDELNPSEVQNVSRIYVEVSKLLADRLGDVSAPPA